MTWRFFRFEAMATFGDRFERANRQEQDEMIAFVVTRHDMKQEASNGDPQ